MFQLSDHCFDVICKQDPSDNYLESYQEIEAELPDEQAGFQAGRSTVDMLCVLQIIIEKSLEWQNPISIVFIDYRIDFDTVNHLHLFACLFDFGFLRHKICLLQNLYTG